MPWDSAKREKEECVTRPPVPPFGEEGARRKVKAAQDAWNARDPEKVAQAYTEDSEWRNRDEEGQGWRSPLPPEHNET